MNASEAAGEVVASAIELCDWEDFSDSIMIDAEIERIYGVAEALEFSRVEADEESKIIK